MKLAVIGGHGHHSLLHLALAEPEIKLVAVASDGYDNAAEDYKSNAAFGSHSQYFENYERMLDEVKPDIVSVGCQYAFNAKASKAAMERGIPVVSEKPIANSLEELNELDKLVRGGASLVPEFTMRWIPAYIAARKVIAEGRIGKVSLVNAQKSYRFGSRPDFYKKRATYGGTIPWVAVHAIDYVRWCTGIDYVSVYGSQGNSSRPDYPEMEDNVALAFEMSDGASATITADYLRPATAPSHGDDRLRVMGTEGYVEVRNDECHLCAQGEPEQKLPLEPVSHEQMGRDMLASALGERNCLPWKDTFRVTEVCLKARDAADQRRVISL
ncbi:MAG: Gfo/Idh/MocA family oxidoreductase [Chthoniobacterales bacterium]